MSAARRVPQRRAKPAATMEEDGGETGAVCARGRTSLARFVGGGLLGVAPINALGAAWLAAQLHLGLGTALTAGVAPFAWLDVLKAVAAGLAARSMVNLPLGLPAAQRGR